MSSRKMVIDQPGLKGIQSAQKHIVIESLKRELSHLLSQASGLVKQPVVLRVGMSSNQVDVQVARQVNKRSSR
jgi:hypothetical protein